MSCTLFAFMGIWVFIATIYIHDISLVLDKENVSK